MFFSTKSVLFFALAASQFQAALALAVQVDSHGARVMRRSLYPETESTKLRLFRRGHDLKNAKYHFDKAAAMPAHIAHKDMAEGHKYMLNAHRDALKSSQRKGGDPEVQERHNRALSTHKLAKQHHEHSAQMMEDINNLPEHSPQRKQALKEYQIKQEAMHRTHAGEGVHNAAEHLEHANRYLAAWQHNDAHKHNPEEPEMHVHHAPIVPIASTAAKNH